MADRPAVSPMDWVVVGHIRCVVAAVRDAGDPFGDCEVVCNPSKPANRDIRWDGSAWQFVESGDYGGYAEKYERLRPYVNKLLNRSL